MGKQGYGGSGSGRGDGGGPGPDSLHEPGGGRGIASGYSARQEGGGALGRAGPNAETLPPHAPGKRRPLPRLLPQGLDGGRCLAGGWARSVPWARPARPSPRPRPRPHALGHALTGLQARARAPPSAPVFAQGLPFHCFSASTHPDPEPRVPSPCPRLPPRPASRHPGPSTLPPGRLSPRSPEAALWTELLFLHVFVERRPSAFLGLPVRPPLSSQPRPRGKWRAACAVLIGPKRGWSRGSWCREIRPPPPAALSWHCAAYSLPGRHRTRERRGSGRRSQESRGGTGCEVRPL